MLHADVCKSLQMNADVVCRRVQECADECRCCMQTCARVQMNAMLCAGGYEKVNH